MIKYSFEQKKALVTAYLNGEERYIQDQGIEKPKRKYTKRQAKKM